MHIKFSMCVYTYSVCMYMYIHVHVCIEGYMDVYSSLETLYAALHYVICIHDCVCYVAHNYIYINYVHSCVSCSLDRVCR